MSKRRYTPLEKAEALRTIRQYNGDLSRASDVLNIPVRTLYDWRKAMESQDSQEIFDSPPPPHSPNAQLPPIEQSAFGMTRDELIRALEIEYIPSPYENLRQALMMHIAFLQAKITEDPDLAHIRALAVSRMLDDVMRLEPLCRLEKPPINIIKYEYKDGTYHNIPEWSNRVYERADQAYNAVLMQARREYYALKGEVYDETPPSMPLGQEFDTIEQPTLAELAEMHFTAEDFIPRHTGIMAWMLNHEVTKPADDDFYDDDNS